MDYKEKYEHGLECIQEILSGAGDSIKTSILRKRLQPFFPELAESEDEKNIKDLIDELKCSLRAANCQNDACGGGHEKRIALLEWGIAWLEKQIEVTKTSDQKFEPKFHPGDWIIDKIGNIYQIEKAFKSIAKDIFGYTIVGGGYFNDNSNVRLWTIEDAKDGDVLAVNSMPFIYNGNKNEVTVGAYCGFTEKHIFSFAYNYAINQNITPATKEQCDRLFAKMRELGYKWDSAKKDFKRI